MYERLDKWICDQMLHRKLKVAHIDAYSEILTYRLQQENRNLYDEAAKMQEKYGLNVHVLVSGFIYFTDIIERTK